MQNYKSAWIYEYKEDKIVVCSSINSKAVLYINGRKVDEVDTLMQKAIVLEGFTDDNTRVTAVLTENNGEIESRVYSCGLEAITRLDGVTEANILGIIQ